MRSRLSVRWLASSAMVIAAWLPAHMASANLACQARASYPYSQPPVRVDFKALVANGVVPLGFHWDFGDGGSSTEQNPSHDPEPYTWSWRFGDDGTSTLQSPLHTYSGVGTYYAVATLHTPCGSYDCWPTLRVTALGTKTGVEPPVPRELHLDPPLPNPFRVMTGIGFVLPVAGRVRLTVSDVEGRLVATLVDGCRSAVSIETGCRRPRVSRGPLDAGEPVPPRWT